ncbi:MAG: DUF4832 domain-containing protein [Paludibacteraceae bacterium]|nr:DUF4832 domain-containing protein [Paludibacteraceae bacterium]
MMKKSNLLLSVLLIAAMTVNAAVVTYTSDNTTIFKNPERGFTEEMSYGVSDAHPNVVKGSVDDNWGSRYNMTLAVVLYNFKKFKFQPLSQAILNGFDEDMQELRSRGLKCVLRFAYTESQSDIVDAVPDTVELHLEQLKPYLKKNADVIYTVEAGFIGSWGEWYYTKNYGNESQHMNSKRRRVVDALLMNVPQDRFVLFRYPMIKTEYFGDETPLTSLEAFSGTDRARMGCHNDAFLNNWGNDGTYASDDESDDPKVRKYVATETLYVPNGGETNVESNTLAEKVYTKAPDEMATYHWSFCGSSYATQVTRRWRDSGIFDTLNIHMGYRYNLVQAAYSDEAAPGGRMNVVIHLRNDGYAPLYNQRTAYLVLKNSAHTYCLPISSDPRYWRPGHTFITERELIPSDAQEGTYHLYLWMPDRYESIKNDPRFAVRFANVNVWDAQTGYNDLGATVSISKNAPLDPGPLPVLPEGIDEVTENGLQVMGPRKIMENGTLYIAMPDGRRCSIDGMVKW